MVSTVTSQQKSSWFESWLESFGLHVLPVHAWVLSRYSGFLPPSTSDYVRLIGDCKLILRVNVSMHGCLPLCGNLSRVFPASYPMPAGTCGPELD